MPTEAQIEYAERADSLETTSPKISTPEWSSGHFLAQRKVQRNILLWFSIIMSSLSFVFLVVVVIFQIYYRVNIDPNFEVLSDKGLEVLAVAVFGQVFGVVYVIAHSVWNNREFDLITKDCGNE